MTSDVPSSLEQGDPAAAQVLSDRRLAAVRRSGLLDTEPESSFDALTRLARKLLGVPVSFMSVVDAGRDFYKSQDGFPEPLANERQLDGRTFCHYTLDRGEPLAIADTLAEPRWRAVPTVERLGVRAYLGVPLVFDGENIGSLCAIDTSPHAWTDTEVEIMQELAASASRELALREALKLAREESRRALALAKSREEIVAVVAHDLRTPLQVLQLSALTLRHTPRDGQETAVLARMDGAVSSIAQMAQDLLVNSATLPPEASTRQPVDATALVADATEMMAPIAQRAGVRLRVAQVPAGIVDVVYSHMLRVLGNVLGNAIKFSPPAGNVTIAGELDREFLLLAVSDEGPGISEQARERAFERGYQGAEGMVQGGGAGLGLAIVHRLVTEHGGTVQIEPLPARGTRVSLTLPLRGARTR